MLNDEFDPQKGKREEEENGKVTNKEYQIKVNPFIFTTHKGLWK